MDDIQIIRHPAIRIPHRADPRDELWAIGDVHGRADLLHAILTEIERTPEVADRQRSIISLGDVIDRGPDSLLCLSMLIDADANGVLGNHEQMALLAAHTREYRWHREGFYPAWTDQGGARVLEEGLGPDWHRDQHPTRIPAAFGRKRWDWIRTLPLYRRSGDIPLVHGGVDPTRPLEASLRARWDGTLDTHPVWIRNEFLKGWGRRPRSVFVVHGHTPGDNAGRAGDECNGARLNCDLGSYASGGVRAARIVDDQVEIVDAWGSYSPQYESTARALRRGRV